MPDRLSPCQKLSIEDCTNTKIGNACPQNCEVCLYRERFYRDDCNWTPEPTDKQYNHWLNRDCLPCEYVKPLQRRK
jgi:hypothetical protein